MVNWFNYKFISIFKTKALECVSLINQKCMPRLKILDVSEGVGEALFYPYNVSEVVIRLIILVSFTE